MATTPETYLLDYDQLLESDPPFRCPSCQSVEFRIFCLWGVTQRTWSGTETEHGSVDRVDSCDEVDFILSVTCAKCERVLMDRTDCVLAAIEKELS